MIQRWRWHDWDLRRLYLCSLLVFCLIFNHQAESPTFVVAVAELARGLEVAHVTEEAAA